VLWFNTAAPPVGGHDPDGHRRSAAKHHLPDWPKIAIQLPFQYIFDEKSLNFPPFPAK
jgi:hypothetical protein